MSADERRQRRQRRREQLEEWSPKINAVALVLLAVLGVVAIDTARTNRAQNEALAEARAEQVEQNTTMVECLDRYTTKAAAGREEVRRATKRFNDALTRYAGSLLPVVAARTLDNLGSAEVRDAAAALEAYHEAAADLDRALLANPEPPPPSKVCATVSPTAKQQ